MACANNFSCFNFKIGNRIRTCTIASDLLVNKTFAEADAILNEFTELMQTKGTQEGNPDVLEDAVAFAGVSKVPARIKCALLGWMAFKDAAVRINTTTEGE